jgi:hypothetical protein
VSSESGFTFQLTVAYAIVPSLDTAPLLAEANGLTALITSGSLDTLVTDWLTADSCAVTAPVLAWKTICPPYPPCCGNVLFSTSSPAAESLPEIV